MDQPLTRQSVSTNTMEEVFGKFGEMFKQFSEDTTYENFDEIKIYFDSNMLIIDDTSDIELILEEINHISRRIFMYGVLYESQQRVTQELEDEFERWQAEMYVRIDSATESIIAKDGSTKTKKVSKTETAKEKYIMTAYDVEYEAFRTKIRNENYKLGLVKRVCGGLDSFSYKLHAMLNYRQIALQKGL